MTCYAEESYRDNTFDGYSFRISIDFSPLEIDAWSLALYARAPLNQGSEKGVVYFRERANASVLLSYDLIKEESKLPDDIIKRQYEEIIGDLFKAIARDCFPDLGEHRDIHQVMDSMFEGLIRTIAENTEEMKQKYQLGEKWNERQDRTQYHRLNKT